jgi:hypothetical protein
MGLTMSPVVVRHFPYLMGRGERVEINPIVVGGK